MDPAILGEYALKTALQVALKTAKQVALNIKKLYTSEVDDGITAAFEFALNDWSKHAPTTSDKVRLSKALEEYIQSSISYEALDLDTRAFIDCFKKRLSEEPAAHNYLMTLRADMQAKDQEQNLLEHHKTQELIQGLMAQLGGLNMSPQDIQALLQELPLEQGLERTESALEEMCSKGRIPSVRVKQLVLEFVRFHLEDIAKRDEEARQLRVAGDSYLAESLEEINRIQTGESDQSLTAVYEKHLEQAQQKEIRLLKELIEAAQLQFTFGEARKFYDRLIELSPTIEHHLNYARLLYSLNDFKMARKHYEKALKALRKLSKNPKVCKPALARTLNELGMLHRDTNDLKQAQICYEEALQIRRELAEQNPDTNKPYLAVVLNNLGNLFIKTNELKKASACNKEALQIFQELADQNPEVYKSYVALTLSNLGGLLLENNDLKQAQTCYEDSLKLYQELLDQNLETYNSNVAMIWNNLGCLLKETNDFKQAQTFYEDALKLYQELSDQNPEAYKSKEAMIWNNLGNLLRDTSEHKQAQTCYEEALQIRRELAEYNPEVYKPDVAMTLNNLGILLSLTNELMQARSSYEEALQVYRKLDEKTPRAYKPEVAMALNNLALLYLDLEDEEEAEKAYQEAHDIYQDLASHHPRAYEIDYAQLLVMGFNLLGRPKEYLEEAKEILGKYSDHPKAQELLSRIEELGKR